MKHFKVLLVGYYGKANFGDDVLLKVTHGLVRQWQPDAEVSVLCDQYLDDYLPELLGENLRILKFGDRENFDLIIHGGGGTFFDFTNHGAVGLISNVAIKLMGFGNYAAFDRFVRKILGKQRFSAKRRIGWGIGVGTYTSSSNKLKHHIPALLDFDMLAVRDSESLRNLEVFNIGDRAILGSDLAFLSNYWVPFSGLHKHHETGAKPNLGMVLRDWLYGSSENYIESFLEILPELQNIYELSFFVFDKRVDQHLLDLFKNYTTYVWDPPKTGFDRFCSLLAQQDALVTSRAHGAICGAVLGIPSVLIGIEPKLKTIYEMLPQSTTLLSPSNLDIDNLIREIDTILECRNSIIVDEVTRNRVLIDNAITVTLSADV